MKQFTKAIVMLICLNAGAAQATASKVDDRNQSVLGSKMVHAILLGLKQEQNLSCKIVTEEDGSQSIYYTTEDGLSKFRATFSCDSEQLAVIKGVIGDGGQTLTQSFELIQAP